jgi:hypothetical protein
MLRGHYFMRPAMLIQCSFSDLEYASKGYLTRRDRLLRDLDALTPWPALLATVEPFCPKGEGPGRAPIGLEKMLRMVIAQQCLGPSDEGIEDALDDSHAVRRFVGDGSGTRYGTRYGPRCDHALALSPLARSTRLDAGNL